MIRIYIDQGHNPRNPNSGAEANGYLEQDITYTVGVALAALLDANGNFETLLSRKSEDEILGTSNATSLAARTSEANAWGADYFISIHVNASEFTSATGSEGFVYSLSSPAYALSQDIVAAISQATGYPDRGVTARPTLWVLRKTQMPSTLIEIGFITNKEEADLMATDPDLYAGAIYNGILKYFGLD